MPRRCLGQFRQTQIFHLQVDRDLDYRPIDPDISDIPQIQFFRPSRDRNREMILRPTKLLILENVSDAEV